MKLCDDMKDFRHKLAGVCKKSAFPEQISFDWDKP